MAVYIVWKEQTTEFTGRTPDKYGTYTPDFKPVIKTRSARWSTEETPEMIARAKAYIADNFEDRPGAHVGFLPD